MGKGGKTIWNGDGFRVDMKQDGSKVLVVDVTTTEEAREKGHFLKTKFDENGSWTLELHVGNDHIGENEKKINKLFITQDGKWLSSKDFRKRR